MPIGRRNYQPRIVHINKRKKNRLGLVDEVKSTSSVDLLPEKYQKRCSDKKDYDTREKPESILCNKKCGESNK